MNCSNCNRLPLKPGLGRGGPIKLEFLWLHKDYLGIKGIKSLTIVSTALMSPRDLGSVHSGDSRSPCRLCKICVCNPFVRTPHTTISALGRQLTTLCPGNKRQDQAMASSSWEIPAGGGDSQMDSIDEGWGVEEEAI